jgi:hypothetical protein
MAAGMNVRESPSHLRQTKKLRLPRLQAGVRRVGDPATFHPPLGDRRADLWWHAQVTDLTQTGVGLVLSRHFGAGTLLEVNLPSPADPAGKTYLLRVVDVQAAEQGQWCHRGAFVRHLSEDEIQALR